VIYRIPELQTCVAFVLIWIQLGIEHIAQRNFIPRGSREHISSGGKMGHISCTVFFTSLHIFYKWFISSTCAGQSMSSTLVCSDHHSSSI
jgi:hypothetical protein